MDALLTIHRAIFRNIPTFLILDTMVSIFHGIHIYFSIHWNEISGIIEIILVEGKADLILVFC